MEKQKRKKGMNTREEPATWVYDVLKPEQLTTAKRVRRFGRRRLSRGTIVLLWVLRLYVVVMLFVIAYQIWMVLQEHASTP